MCICRILSSRYKRKPVMARLLCVLAVLVLVAVPVRFSIAAEQTGKQPTFEKNIVPLVKARCFHCHGEKTQKGGLDLRRRFTMEKGGDSGPLLDLKKPGESLLLKIIAEGRMPPEGEQQLTTAERELIRAWVTTGAPLAGNDEQPLPKTGPVSFVTEDDRKFWAFQTPKRPAVPAVKQKNFVRTPIDAFLLEKIEPHDASFMPRAEKRTLVRRLYFDLHGLPPTPEQVATFVTDSRSDAYEKLIDELLDSPRYGERWGRHWLDVAGYADSDGYLDADRLRPEAWRYRDYVIRSFNNDKPYSRFLQEQIAGDELANWKQMSELTPAIIDNLVATGFLRSAPDPTYPGYIEQPEVNKVIADTMEVVSTGLLGLTIQCARCHDHKVDPISQRDYYELWAFFNPSFDAQKWIVSSHRNLPMATKRDAERITKGNQQADARIKQLQTDVNTMTGRFRGKVFTAELSHIKDVESLKKVKQALNVDEKKRNAAQKELVAKYAPNVNIAEADLSKRFLEYQQKLAKLRAAITSETALKESIVQIRGLYDLEGEPNPTHLLRRGDYRTPGVVVEPNVPEVLAPAGSAPKIQPKYKSTGRRLVLARWLTDPKNPLTARVQVNRVWAQHFGTGIVSSLDNFGHAGARPTHSELLDWLTTEFIAHAWRHKHLHRLILNSSAYRQSSQPNAKLQSVDPDNKLLGSWPPRRIEGEAIRDTVLSAAGKLNLKMSGQPVPVSLDKQGLVTVADDPESNRRSIYLIVRRSQPVTLLELFDTPTMETNCTRRTESIVVTQALTMLNSEFTARNAKSLAERVIRQEPSDVPNRLNALLQLAWSRQATAEEQQEMTTFLDAVRNQTLKADTAADSGEKQKLADLAAWTQLAVVILNSNEFLYVP